MSTEKLPQRVGIFGGTFDPIHFGHINLAIELSEAHRLSEVILIPAGRNPLKKMQPQASFQHRLAMAQLAVENIPSFCVSAIEGENKGEEKNPSYTIDTVLALKQQRSDVSFHLLLGEDLLPSLIHWRSIEHLFQLAPPLIASRFNDHLDFPQLAFSNLPSFLQEAVKKGWTKTPLLDISATAIRSRLRNRLYCNHLLPIKVLDYIADNHLYLF